MKRIFSIIVASASLLASAIGLSAAPAADYNKGINIIPAPASLQMAKGRFYLKNATGISASGTDARRIAEMFASKIAASSGIALPVADGANIAIAVDPSLGMKDEAYTLEVTPKRVSVKASTPAGAFYGMQTLMQLLPAEIESTSVVNGIDWSAPCVSIADEPRFGYRGFMLDACRHFIPVDVVKKQIDALALFKVNRLHWHLTEDQGWRIEIKKYPRLTQVGSKRDNGDGTIYDGFYTQAQIKDIVAYAAERFVTIVPEIEVPGHELAAIAAYPELSCKGERVEPRKTWGVEDIVMCPGKETMFNFLEDVVAEVAPLFPGKYFHIGGDECPKRSWKECPRCQARIKAEGLEADGKHTAEERLQSYVISRMENILAKHGKSIIGWDEILEGGLSPNATVMSWRGEEGGMAAAMQNHGAIMTPSSRGLYTDYYQGDPKIEPTGIGGYVPLAKTYSYEPITQQLKDAGKEQFIVGVQCNNWAEFYYTTDHMEYMLYPRALALSEIAWSQPEKKDFADFARRVNNACVRLDAHNVTYHIPLPEQPGGSYSHVAFTDRTQLSFSNTRDYPMVYTLDGSIPSAKSARYSKPLIFTDDATLNIATLMPSGKTSTVRTITIDRQQPSEPVSVANPQNGLKMRMTFGYYLHSADLAKASDWTSLTILDTRDIRGQIIVPDNVNNLKMYSAEASGYINIPADGVYVFSTNLNELWLDGKLLISNDGQCKRFSRFDAGVALKKGLHPIKIQFLGNIIGGMCSFHDDGSVYMRRVDGDDTANVRVEPAMLFH